MQRAAIINGLKDSVGTETRELSAQMVSELLLITQYYDTLESICNAKGKTVFLPNVSAQPPVRHVVCLLAASATRVRAAGQHAGAACRLPCTPSTLGVHMCVCSVPLIRAFLVAQGIATVGDTMRQIRAGVLGRGGKSAPPTSVPRTTPWNPHSARHSSDSDSAGGFDDFGFGVFALSWKRAQRWIACPVACSCRCPRRVWLIVRRGVWSMRVFPHTCRHVRGHQSSALKLTRSHFPSPFPLPPPPLPLTLKPRVPRPIRQNQARPGNRRRRKRRLPSLVGTRTLLPPLRLHGERLGPCRRLSITPWPRAHAQHWRACHIETSRRLYNPTTAW